MMSTKEWTSARSESAVARVVPVSSSRDEDSVGGFAKGARASEGSECGQRLGRSRSVLTQLDVVIVELAEAER